MPSSEPRQGPIFIAGCGRSGTSLLRTLVDAHPDVYIPSESLFMADYLQRGDRLPAWVLRPLLFHEPQLRCWYDGPARLQPTVAATLAAVHQYMADAAGASIWGQKTPRFVRYRRLIDAAFDGCRWLLVYRDPRAVCASMRRSGQHTNSVSRGTARWKNDNRALVEFVRDPGTRPANVHLVRYEDLITDFDEQLTGIFRFLGLTRVPTAQLMDNARPVFFSRSRFENNTIRNGVLPDTGRIDDWKSILTPAEIAYIEAACAPEMASLGYAASAPTTQGGLSTRDTIQKLRDIEIVYRYLRYWPSYPFYTLLRKVILLAFARAPVR